MDQFAQHEWENPKFVKPLAKEHKLPYGKYSANSVFVLNTNTVGDDFNIGKDEGGDPVRPFYISVNKMLYKKVGEVSNPTASGPVYMAMNKLGYQSKGTKVVEYAMKPQIESIITANNSKLALSESKFLAANPEIIAPREVSSEETTPEIRNTEEKALPLQGEAKSETLKEYADRTSFTFISNRTVLRKDDIEFFNDILQDLIGGRLLYAQFALEDLGNRQYIPYIDALKENGFEQVSGKEHIFSRGGKDPHVEFQKSQEKVVSSQPMTENEVVSRYTNADVKANPDKIYVFGDNNKRTGTGGQAQIRNNENAFGISTKLAPNNTAAAFMSDNSLQENKDVIDSDIAAIKDDGRQIVFPKDGFGTGLAKLKVKAPQTYAYLKQRLQEEFGFNNDTGKISTQETAEIDSQEKEAERGFQFTLPLEDMTKEGDNFDTDDISDKDANDRKEEC